MDDYKKKFIADHAGARIEAVKDSGQTNSGVSKELNGQALLGGIIIGAAAFFCLNLFYGMNITYSLNFGLAFYWAGYVAIVMMSLLAAKLRTGAKA